MRESVAVLLAAYNGEKYIKPQILSILSSRLETPLSITIGLDPSTDDTREVVDSIGSESIFTFCYETPSGGAKYNFARLVEHALLLPDRYYAFSDQDDVWDSDRLAVGIKLLKEHESRLGDGVPLLVFSDSRVVDEELGIVSASFMEAEKLDPAAAEFFNRLIVQNVGQGCTFLFNRALLELAAPVPGSARMHDHWLMLVASAFGKILYVDRPLLSYRQHSNNVVGAAGYGFFRALARACKGSQEIRDSLSFSRKQAEAFVLRYGSMLDRDRYEFLIRFVGLPQLGFWARRLFIYKYGVRMSGVLRRIGLYLYI
ncbi:glycosyltransferase family 2 protein [Aquipseudomonas alcaligenes]|jgi:glycosyltransferase involved in cell wall biosynthesis|uniref:Glycosyl transferase family 2 n=1 Tax=Aquipseudomonas alcaligenes TaxID=43263 RepID=A0A1N6RRK9_AQUAC|nr:glycosyltransferase family 2 protein [Pseudomonas alcaligenes]SIQ31483.1 Glycosyl transferase family 2 [Pseudomonas alcaligenes]